MKGTIPQRDILSTCALWKKAVEWERDCVCTGGRIYLRKEERKNLGSSSEAGGSGEEAGKETWKFMKRTLISSVERVRGAILGKNNVTGGVAGGETAYPRGIDPPEASLSLWEGY